MAGFATRNRVAGHPEHSTDTRHALRLETDHLIGAGQRLLTGRSDASFALKHSVLLGLTALRSGDAMDLLSQVALNSQPLPPKERPGTLDGHHGFEDAIAGEMLALDAIDGLESLADAGNSEAVSHLVRAASDPSNSIRAATLTALASHAERRDAFDQAVSALPRELRHLAQMRRIPVEEVPQISDPRIHLAGPQLSSRAAPPLPPERVERGTEKPAPGAPSVSRS